MKDFAKFAMAFLCIILLMVGLGWFFTANEFGMRKFFAPRQEAVRRETFEQSKAYRQGAVQELENMQFQYIKADAGHKAALASIILHRAADFQDLPPDLQQFVNSLRNQNSTKY